MNIFDLENNFTISLSKYFLKLPFFYPNFMKIAPAHKFFPKLFLAGFIWLAIVDVVEGVDTCVIAEISKNSF